MCNSPGNWPSLSVLELIWQATQSGFDRACSWYGPFEDEEQKFRDLMDSGEIEESAMTVWKIKQCQKHWGCIISFLFVLISTYFCRKRIGWGGRAYASFFFGWSDATCYHLMQTKSCSSVKAHSISMAYICVNPTFWVWACKTGALGQQIWFLCLVMGFIIVGVKQQPACLNISKYPK